mmetsp:Transcript_22834/g.63114  ORF Transcript_22834/g.63114 Transcript_22834/m.63114 type:complete len:237 (-) Transcript_22834:1679-2389(-)
MILAWYCVSKAASCTWDRSSACFNFSSYSISCSFFSASSSSNFWRSTSTSDVNFSVSSLVFSCRCRSLSRSWYSVCIVSSATCCSNSAMRFRFSSRSLRVTSTSAEYSTRSCSLLAAALASLSLTSCTNTEPSSEAVATSCSSQDKRSRVMEPWWHLVSANSPVRGYLYVLRLPVSVAAIIILMLGSRQICVKGTPVSTSLVIWVPAPGASSNSLIFRSEPAAYSVLQSGVLSTDV